MFQAAHVTRIQVYPLLEPVFAPDKLKIVGLWERLTSWDRSELKNRREQRHTEIFKRRESLRDWIRSGYPIAVPNAGILKPLRRPDIPYDRFYAPFFQTNRGRVEKRWQKQDGPMPFYPLQVLPRADMAEIRMDEDDRDAFADLLGAPIRTWSMSPMLIVYPAGAVCGQFRLYVETKEPLSADALKALVTVWDRWPWQMRFKQANREEHGRGPSDLLDGLVRRFYEALVDEPGEELFAPDLRQSKTLINVLGSLHDGETGGRHKQAQRWMSQLAGVAYSETEDATIWGDRHAEEIPWIVAGNDRVVLAVDDAARHHLRRRRLDGNAILESRRALRNRAVSVIEMALATRLLYQVYDEVLTNELAAWEAEPLQGRWGRTRSFLDEPALGGRIYGTLFHELADIQARLRLADPNNAKMWESLYGAVLHGPSYSPQDMAAIIAGVYESGLNLMKEKRARQMFQENRVIAALEAIKTLSELAALGAGGIGAGSAGDAAGEATG